MAELNVPLPEFELERKRASGRVRTAAQAAREALERRFAAIGGLQSGAHIKAQADLERGIEEGIGGSLEDIEMRETAERRRIAELAEQRKFVAAESEKGRALTRELEAAQRGLQERGLAFQEKAHAATLGLEERKLDIGKEQFGKQFGLAQEQFTFQKDFSQRQLEFQRQVFSFEKLGKIAELNFSMQKSRSDARLNAFNAAMAMLQSGAIKKEQFASTLAQYEQSYSRDVPFGGDVGALMAYLDRGGSMPSLVAPNPRPSVAPGRGPNAPSFEPEATSAPGIFGGNIPGF